MGKRLFECAKELALSSKEVLERCKKLGFAIPSQLTVVDDKVQSEIRKDMGLADLQLASAPWPPAAPPPGAPAPPKAAGAAKSAPMPTVAELVSQMAPAPPRPSTRLQAQATATY